jgi:hypothetical protein
MKPFSVAHGQMLRCKKYGLTEHFTQEEWESLCRYYGDLCLSCYEPLPLCADHIFPLALGGWNTIDNIQPLCKMCNSRKRIMIINFRNPDAITINLNTVVKCNPLLTKPRTAMTHTLIMQLTELACIARERGWHETADYFMGEPR